MFTLCPSRGLGLGGKPCQGTGARTGRATPTSMARASPSRSPPVMAGLSLATMLHLLIGNLDRHMRGHSFRNQSSPILKFELCACNLWHLFAC